MYGDWGEFKVGSKVRSASRTITDGDFSAIVNLSWENGPLHSDEEFMKTSRFGRRILGGPCLIARVAGVTSAPLWNMWARSRLNCIAGLGIDNVRYLGPFHPGDTLTVEMEVLELRETRTRPGRFVSRIKDRAFKQDGQPVLEMERTHLLEPIKTAKG